MTASRSASTSSRRGPRARVACAAALLACLLAGRTAAAASWSDLQGHLALGYAKLMNQGAPGGSLAIGAGVELPVLPDLSAGVDVGFALLGSQTFERGSLSADLDHNLFEALLLLHMAPARGPFSRISLGPGVFHARASLTTAAPVEFEDLPVEETAPGMGVGLELAPKRAMTVKAGIEAAVRTVWMEHGTWTVAQARLVVHY